MPMFKRFLIYFPYLVFISICLYFIVTTSFYVRYWVDDFCSAVFLRNNGFVGAQIGWWKSWTGRYSAVFFTDLFESMGPWVVRILPLVLFSLLVLTSRVIFFKSIIFSVVFILLVLINAPNIIQSFYWQTGSLNYTIPFVFLNAFLSLLILRENKRRFLLGFILLFIASGFSEAFALSLLVFIFLVIASLYILKLDGLKSRLKFAISGFLGVLVSLFLMSLSPGNDARSLTVTKPESLVFVVKSSVLATKWYLLRMASLKPFLYSLLIIFASTLFFAKKMKIDPKKTVLILVFALANIVFSTMAVIFSGYYSMSIIPPERTLFIVFYFVLFSFYVISLSLFGLFNYYFSSDFIKKKIFVLILFLNFFAIFFLTRSVFSHWLSVRSEIANYAVSWDREVKNLPEIKNIKPVGGLDSFTDNKGWVSSCVAAYYGFEKLKIVDAK